MDLAAASDVLALDTEKIIDVEHKNKSGDVAVVDIKGRVVFWAYVRLAGREVCRFNTKQTGLTLEKLQGGIAPEMVINSQKETFKF